MKKLVTDFLKNEDGITAIEYAMLGVAMAVGLTAIMGSTTDDSGFLGSLKGAFTSIANKISAAG
ncbi:Flp family type IVb pilin [Photobacterium sanguinicancri]|uniref:Flp family type IVb pilin n=1 Tax=Photobacterium sanguinicancri TaxID=875932 RepID=UPI0026E21204|nr:Flp family type IVb pilin [Photobacterium sanguinicancri]MDO6498441.1 Flp family type IVb pilin [Photobacterium sanguinicancri]